MRNGIVNDTACTGAIRGPSNDRGSFSHVDRRLLANNEQLVIAELNLVPMRILGHGIACYVNENIKERIRRRRLRPDPTT